MNDEVLFWMKKALVLLHRSLSGGVLAGMKLEEVGLAIRAAMLVADSHGYAEFAEKLVSDGWGSDDDG